MSEPLPPLRRGLDIFPSQDPDRPGFVLRDPMLYVDVLAFLPPLLAQTLPLFDGVHTEVDLRTALTRMTGEVEVAEVAQSFVGSLASAGFLETSEFEERKKAREEEFASREEREAAHADSGYPAEPEELRAFLDEYSTRAEEPNPGPGSIPSPTPNPGSVLNPQAERADLRHVGTLSAIAAPHVSPDGGWRSYARAYRDLDPSLSDRTFVILGTSHYGEPEKFGLTRKGFRTPFGLAEVDVDRVELLRRAAPDSVIMEDYCHRIEHSIEFQVVYLQRAMGPNVRILPILCGPFWEALTSGNLPEATLSVGRFLDALGGMAEDSADLFWLLGVDLAHVGNRYGDEEPAMAETGHLGQVRQRDRERLDRLCSGDRQGFFDLVKPNQDDLKWCGLSPLYSFAYARPSLRADVWSYEQWNIDSASVVSFTAMGYYAESGTP